MTNKSSSSISPPHVIGSITLNQNHPLPNPVTSPNDNDRLAMSEHNPTTTIKKSLAPFDLNELPKPRGRSKGSKKKARSKCPIYVPQPQLESTKKDLLIEIPPGCDIIQMVQKYSQDHYNAGIIVKNGIGKIRNVSLQNYSTFEPPITHYGTFDLVSINGVNIGRPVSINRKETSGTSYSSFEHGSRINYMTIVMAGSKGNVLGGRVVGKLMALSNVLLFASTIKDYEFHEIMPDLPDYHVKHPYTSGVGQSTVEGLGSGSSSSSDSSSRASESTDEDPTWGSIPKSSKRIRLSDK